MMPVNSTRRGDDSDAALFAASVINTDIFKIFQLLELTNPQRDASDPEYSAFVNGFKDENAIVYDDQVDYFPDILKNFLEYNQAKESLETQKVSPTSTGFLPINLNLEIGRAHV